MSIAGLFDLSGKATTEFYTNGTGGTFRERFGQGLFTDEQKRLQQYTDQDIARVSHTNHRQLERIQNEAVDMSEGDLVATTGTGRNRVARTTEQQFGSMENNTAFRLQGGPLRA